MGSSVGWRAQESLHFELSQPQYSNPENTEKNIDVKIGSKYLGTMV